MKKKTTLSEQFQNINRKIVVTEVTSIHTFLASDWRLNARFEICELYHGENKTDF
jgi:hypothetical protein